MASNSRKAAVAQARSTNRIKQFLEETWVELRYKVTWPAKTPLIRSTAVVLAVVVIVSVFIYILDTFFGFVLRNTILR
jgi:preprotein translocase subunit SecE